MQRKRITLDEVNNSNFYQLPKFLFEAEFKGLSNDAKILYALLKERANLSIKNNWINENNEVYFIYTIDEIEEMLQVSRMTAVKAKKELVEYKLLEDERVGLKQANKLYLMVVTIENTLKYKNYTSRSIKNRLQEVQNLDSNKNDLNKTYKNKNNNKTNKKNVVVAPDDESLKEDAENIVVEFKKEYQADLDLNITKKLIKEKGVNELEQGIRNYKNYISGRQINNIAGDFVTFVKRGYTKPIALKATPQHLMYEQRNYTDEDYNEFVNVF
jgi:hypothetical protein